MQGPGVHSGQRYQSTCRLQVQQKKKKKNHQGDGMEMTREVYILLISWGIVALQYCVSLCCTSKGMSYRPMHPLPPWTPPTTPSQPSRFTTERWTELPGYTARNPHSYLFVHAVLMCQSVSNSPLPPVRSPVSACPFSTSGWELTLDWKVQECYGSWENHCGKSQEESIKAKRIACAKELCCRVGGSVSGLE